MRKNGGDTIKLTLPWVLTYTLIKILKTAEKIYLYSI